MRLKNILESSTNFANAIKPMSRQSKDDFLNRVQKAVEFYSPKIENIFDIDLGVIEVEESKDSIYTRFGESVKTIINTFPNIKEIYFELASYTQMSYSNSKIHVPFDFQNKMEYLNISDENLHPIILHEMSHKIWETLGGEPTITPVSGLDDPLLIWGEGFADYCASKHLLNIYPSNFKLNYKSYGHYKIGIKKVGKVAEIFGHDFVKYIPIKWKSLDEII